MKVIKNPIAPGTILPFGGGSVPPGFLLCDGSTISRTTYGALFAAVGIAHGSGNGTTTFHLPDYRGRFLRGRDAGAARDPDRSSRTASNSGGSTGDNVGSVQADMYDSHKHNYVGYGGGSISSSVVWAGPQLNVGATSPAVFTNNIQVSGGNETRPQNANVLYIIKV